MRAVIAGAASDEGRRLVRALLGHYDVIGIARADEEREDTPGLEWRTADLFNLRETELALVGADVAVYLVRRITPASRLMQGDARDLDLIAADNYARAVASSNAATIVADDWLATERPEVMQALAERGAAVVRMTDWLTTTAIASIPPDADERNSMPVAHRRAPRASRVCSVQRLPVPPGRDARFIAEEYARWLPRFMRSLVRVEVDEARTCRFYSWPLAKPMLVLTFADDRSASDRQLYYVTDGLLVNVAESTAGRARLEFRVALCGKVALSALHDFVPRLPWLVYRFTQALWHSYVMRAFGRHLSH